MALTFTNKSPQSNAINTLMQSSRIKLSDSAKKALAQKPLSYYENTQQTPTQSNVQPKVQPKVAYSAPVTPQQTIQTTLANAQNQLQNIQQGVNQLKTQEQAQKKQTTQKNNTQSNQSQFGGLITQLQGASKPSNTQTGLIDQL